MTEIPNDLRQYLAANQQLEYDADSASIGAITLKSLDAVTLSTIMTYPGCQSIIDDPFESFEGMYHIDVLDLVATSDDYGTEGLVCWLPSLSCYAQVDPEHGDVITFPDVSWMEIVSDPIPFLDAQWDSGDIGTRVLPWMHFPFRLDEDDTQLSPYPGTCPIHGDKIRTDMASRHPLFDACRDRDPDAWLAESRSRFPCSGLPVTESSLHFCPSCFDAESDWVAEVDAAIVPLEAKKNKGGFVKCPGCGTGFSPADKMVFQEGLHLRCGQKIVVIERESEEA